MLICYHHTDMDGKSAGYLVHAMRPNTIEDGTSSYIPTDYNSKFNKHTNRDDVFLVDISITESSYEMFMELCKTARTVTYIDHHKSTLDTIAKHKEELQNTSNLTYFVSECACGAALTYSFFKIPSKELLDIRKISEDEEYQINAEYKDGKIQITTIKFRKGNPSDSIFYNYTVSLPLWLYYVDDYDCWKKQNPTSNLIALATDSFNTDIVIEDKRGGYSVFNHFWSDFTSENLSFLNTCIQNGNIINGYIESRYDRELYNTFEWVYEGTTFLCKNGLGNSWNFRNLIDKYDATILFNYNGKTGLWKYSVYSSEKSKFNCKDFCEKFGGGGHVHASGFSSKHLIFTSFSDTKKEDLIFLDVSGDPNGHNVYNWKKEFFKLWNSTDKSKKYSIFDPTSQLYGKYVNIEKAEKDSKWVFSILIPESSPTSVESLYTITRAMTMMYSNSVFFVVYDKNNILSEEAIEVYNSIGKRIEEKSGKYKLYTNHPYKTITKDKRIYNLNNSDSELMAKLVNDLTSVL